MKRKTATRPRFPRTLISIGVVGMFFGLMVPCGGQNNECQCKATPSWISVLSTDGNYETEYSIRPLNEPGGEIARTGLYLVYAEGQSAADLERYWANHIPCKTDWQLLRYKISSAYGMMPFAYLSNEGSETVVCDGAKYWLDREQEPLKIPGDFPCGMYVLSSADGKLALVLVVRGEHCGD